MKRLLILFFSLSMFFNAFSQDKKQIKEISKKYNLYSQGDIFSKADKVAILGNNIRFKLASRQAEETSWKKEMYYKFAVYSVLEGLNDQVFQEITDEYYNMLKSRFESLGIEVVNYDAISEAKSYKKLKDKGLRETEDVKKSWGMAKTYNYSGLPYISWDNAAPFGPQQKLPKELDAVLFNSLVTVDFAHIGIDIEQSGKNYYGSNERVIYTEAKSSVVPVINIDGYTYPSKGTEMLEDNTYIFCLNPKGKQLNFKLDLNESNIESELVFASEVDRCDDCKPEFAQNYFQIMEGGMGTVIVKADSEKYKKAVLDALEKYLDEVFVIIGNQRK